MIVVHVSVQTKDDASAEFVRRISDIQADILKMQGCLRNEWYHHPASPQHFVMYGEFDSTENFESYLNSHAVKRIGEELMPLLAAPPDFRHYQATLLEHS
jgi:quinol monooxygenase YgiN